MTLIVEEGEILVLIAGAIVLFFIYKKQNKLSSLKNFNLFISSFIAYLIGWFLTIAEGIVFYSVFNHLEHFSYFLGSLLLFIWVFNVFGKKEEGGEE